MPARRIQTKPSLSKKTQQRTAPKRKPELAGPRRAKLVDRPRSGPTKTAAKKPVVVKLPATKARKKAPTVERTEVTRIERLAVRCPKCAGLVTRLTIYTASYYDPIFAHSCGFHGALRWQRPARRRKAA